MLRGIIPMSRYVAVFALLGACCTISSEVRAGGHNFFRNNSVGGISIDAAGVVENFQPAAREAFLREMKAGMEAVPGELAAPVEMRMVSLRGLEAALADALKNNLGHIPDEARYLAGLQRIEYVFLYPEQNDIVLAGPGEGWKLDANGQMVGITTGRPVMLLDDLLVALRSVDKARTEGISVSIDPTAEGREAFARTLSQFRTFNPNALPALAEAMGPQQVSLTGVPETSHFARVLVAADYKMKRLGMGLEPSPVAEVPSYLQILQQSRASAANATPRWWLACNYEPIARSEDGLAFQLRGPGVKCLTESEVFADGKVEGTGKTEFHAQKWADAFTEHYDALCAAEPVFGELRNLMDMCVVAALIERHGLLEKAGLSLPLLGGPESSLTLTEWNAPKKIATQCSFIKSGRNYIITASGGVQVESWQVAEKSEVHSAVSDTRAEAAAAERRHWWWN